MHSSNRMSCFLRRNSRPLGFFGLLLLFLFVATAHSQVAHASSVRTNKDRARLLFDKAEKDQLKGDRDDAFDRYETIMKRYRKTSLAPEAQLRMAQILRVQRKWVAAFDAFQDFFTRFPQSNRFDEALASQLQIVRRMAEEHRRLARKGKKPDRSDLKHLPPVDDVSKMYALLLKNGRFSPHAPAIRYEMGVALFREERPKTAKKALRTLVSEHPKHHLADDAAFQIGYIDYTAAMNGTTGSVFGADLAFRDFLSRYPESEKFPEAEHCLAQLAELQVNQLIGHARQYEKMGKPKSALVYYQEIQKKFPELAAKDGSIGEKIEELSGKVSDSARPRALPAAR